MLFEHIDENVAKPIASRVEILQFNFDGRGGAIVRTNHGFLGGEVIDVYDAQQVKQIITPCEDGTRCYFAPLYESKKSVLQRNAATRQYRGR